MIIRKLPGTGVLSRQEQLPGLGRVWCSLESLGQKQQRRCLQALASDVTDDEGAPAILELPACVQGPGSLLAGCVQSPLGVVVGLV
ncbi:hypothetical protein H8959_011147 [Pygathrix nigripes]